jgi:hypothetical protein
MAAFAKRWRRNKAAQATGEQKSGWRGSYLGDRLSPFPLWKVT